MAVQTTTNRITHTGNGTTTVFPFNFRVLAADHLQVYVAGVLKVLGTDYTLSGIGASAGGSVTFIAPPANAASVVFVRQVPLTQLITTENNESIFSQVFDDAIDKLTMITQQLNAVTGRSIYLAENDPTVGDMILPVLSSRANKYLKFDVNGLPTAVDSQIGAQYSGALSADPTTRLDGSPLQAGDLYYNSTTGYFRVYNGSGWANSIAPASLTLVNYSETAATAKTTFTISGGYTAGTIFVYLNGVLLQPTEYTASNGTTVVLATACAIGDDFRCVGFSPLSVADTLARSYNLSDLPSVATARTNLGLGTAAVQNVGTAANNVVQLDSSAKLPAVDGSQLTGLTVSASGRLLRAPQVLTSGTSYTTPSNCTGIYVELVGGGGGGGTGGTNAAGGGGGGAGAYAAKYFSVSAATAYTYAIGAGGTTGAGGNTTFTVGAVTVTAGGGSRGSSAGASTNPLQGGAGGAATNGDVNVTGSDGATSPGGSTISQSGGSGGPSLFGGSGRGGGGSGTINGASGASGGGGGGGCSSGSSGNGGAGLIRIWEFA